MISSGKITEKWDLPLTRSMFDAMLHVVVKYFTIQCNVFRHPPFDCQSHPALSAVHAGVYREVN
jgi:hypothetical protein